MIISLMKINDQCYRAMRLSERRQMIEEIIDMWADGLVADRICGYAEGVELGLESLNRLLSEYEPHVSGQTYYYI